MKVLNPIARTPSRRSTSISVNAGSACRPASQALPLMVAGGGTQRRPRAFSTVLPSLIENCTDTRLPFVEADKASVTEAGVARTSSKKYGGSKDILRTRLSQKSIDVSLETDEFLDYLNNSLRLRDMSTLVARLDNGTAAVEGVRTASSSYASENNEDARSPASPPPDNTLKETNLLRYSRSGNRLSDLRSSSSSNSRRDSTTNVVDTSTAPPTALSSEWQTVTRPRSFCYNRCELIDSQEILPSDSVSQVRVDATPPTPSPKKRTKPHWFGRHWQNAQASTDSLHTIKAQYDGGADCRNFDSPHPGAARPLRTNGKLGGVAGPGGTGAGQKRKASNLSLASISSRTRKGAKKLRVLATTVYQRSSQQLAEVKRKLKKQNEKERKKFEAWKALRRRERPADALKRESEPGFGAFTVHQSRHAHKDWWREGVCRYKAPSWMVFGGTAQ